MVLDNLSNASITSFVGMQVRCASFKLRCTRSGYFWVLVGYRVCSVMNLFKVRVCFDAEKYQANVCVFEAGYWTYHNRGKRWRNMFVSMC